eukprot:3743192-Rhodomonas_salina.2
MRQRSGPARIQLLDSVSCELKEAQCEWAGLREDAGREASLLPTVSRADSPVILHDNVWMSRMKFEPAHINEPFRYRFRADTEQGHAWDFSAVVANKTVLDIGTGALALLAVMAAKAGATKVISAILFETDAFMNAVYPLCGIAVAFREQMVTQRDPGQVLAIEGNQEAFQKAVKTVADEGLSEVGRLLMQIPSWFLGRLS